MSMLFLLAMLIMLIKLPVLWDLFVLLVGFLCWYFSSVRTANFDNDYSVDSVASVGAIGSVGSSNYNQGASAFVDD